MRIYNSLKELSRLKNAVVTIGTFDGVHKGHKKIISRLKEIGAQTGGETCLLTFFPHPRMVLFPDDHGLQLLNTIQEKTELFKEYGIQHLIIHPFSKEFSRTSSTEFVRDILVNTIGTKNLVIGYDHHFGRNREGSFVELSDLSQVYNFDVEQIPEEDVNDIAVSSTKIRNALLSGDIKTASDFLGYNYPLSGTVVHGKKVGNTIGFPTANISVKENYKLIPSHGVYAVDVKIEGDKKIYKGALNIGTRPTFDNGEPSIEVYILEFDGNIYSKKITVLFKERIRDEKKFNSVDELIVAMQNDVAFVAHL
ncbi:MAG TPA: bifunctional riboflavin kinase/FAD synthetase [Bacteroidia bacterium]|nr:bifunctional riboflavin kinase/FAD synthetase [Bacteroidia bacterium]